MGGRRDLQPGPPRLGAPVFLAERRQGPDPLRAVSQPGTQHGGRGGQWPAGAGAGSGEHLRTPGRLSAHRGPPGTGGRRAAAAPPRGTEAQTRCRGTVRRSPQAGPAPPAPPDRGDHVTQRGGRPGRAPHTAPAFPGHSRGGVSRAGPGRAGQVRHRPCAGDGRCPGRVRRAHPGPGWRFP